MVIKEMGTTTMDSMSTQRYFQEKTGKGKMVRNISHNPELGVLPLLQFPEWSKFSRQEKLIDIIKCDRRIVMYQGETKL